MTSMPDQDVAPEQAAKELTGYVNPSSYGVGGHSMRVKGINTSGAVLLDLDLADDGASEPFFFEPGAASEAAPVATSAQQGAAVYAPPGDIDSALRTNRSSSESEDGASDQLMFRTAPEWDADSDAETGPGDNDGSAGAEYNSETSGAKTEAKKKWRTLAAAVSLSRAAQKAQSDHAGQSESDIAHPFARQDSDLGHGPFAGVDLEPRAGMQSISILVVGTRGDVQPFLAVALELKAHGHRVRLATHATYRKFVETQGIEFYPLGGDPAVLSEFVVKNRGILPGSVRDIQEQDEQVRKIVWSCYPACTEADPERRARPFKASCVIANPPSIAHCCVAEALQVPLHMMFTMPWTPTKLFPHPMCVVQSVNVAGAVASMPSEYIAGASNYYSYHAIDMYLFLGFTPQLTKLRRHLKLPAWPNPSTAPAHSITNLKIPFTYLWSPSLQPKPSDWAGHLGVTGFVFLDEDASGYTPQPDLAAFLEPPNEPPIYIGFGSLVLTDPKAATRMIYEASRESGKRVLLSSGWAKLGVDVPNKPDSVFILGNCPHSWLFPKCSAAIHHGGAGTTAAGLRAALPTLVVPFFGDQPFWGDCCLRAGVGPKPVPIAKLSKKAFVHAFEVFDRPEVRSKAQEVSEQMKAEDGRTCAVEHFHNCLKHRSKIIEPGTYGMNPNAIATMKAYVEQAGKATYRTVEETGRNTLKNINVMASGDNLAGVKCSVDTARTSSKGVEAVGAGDSARGGSKGGCFSKMMCGCGAPPKTQA